MKPYLLTTASELAGAAPTKVLACLVLSFRSQRKPPTRVLSPSNVPLPLSPVPFLLSVVHIFCYLSCFDLFMLDGPASHQIYCLMPLVADTRQIKVPRVLPRLGSIRLLCFILLKFSAFRLFISRKPCLFTSISCDLCVQNAKPSF